MMNLLKVDTTFKLLKNSILCFLMFLNTAVFSQNKPIESSSKTNNLSTEITENELLKIANDCVATKEYVKAELIISKNYSRFSESLNVNWLYAHLLSINNNKKEAEIKFKKAISIAPNTLNLEKDYARFLYEMGEIKKVESILDRIIDENSKDAEFLLIQAYLNFWNGDVKSSEAKIARIKEIYPNTAITKSLEEQINELISARVNVNFEYQSDSQPLQYFAHHLAAGQYISKYFNPEIAISTYHFSPEKDLASIVTLSNQIRFYKLKLKVNIHGGVYINLSDKSDWIGGVSLHKDIIKNISVNLGYSKKEVLGTIVSTTFNLTRQDAFGELDYFNKWIILHGGYNQQFYKDGNEIKLIGGWLVSQPINIRNFNFQAGYGYNFSDSKDILFIYDNNGLGVYNPYFTPREQEIHSALFIANYNPTKKLNLQAKVNYGIQATVQNPYPIEVTPNNFEIGGFYDENFKYTEIEGSINYTFSNNFRMSANYINQETFFYNRNNFNLELNYTF
ncbi:MAG: tetratricopeptide repeat protein [Polaribacter sp.]|uniref:hypothetical protein n=1 Tax=Polaribacter sp. TaxID=1920175 RepID=UPI003BAF0E0F